MSGAPYRVAGVVGWPIGHSRSPELYRFWFRRYGVSGGYTAFPAPPEGFARALAAAPALGLVGVNVTVPHKEAALALADRASARARRAGAANMLTFTSAGIEADNSDGFGFLENLRDRAPQWSAEAGPALVLGAGGAARAVVAALLDAGAPAVRLANRTRTRAEALAEGVGGAVEVVEWSDASAAVEGCATLVNATALGLEDDADFPVSLDAAPAEALATDVVYAPRPTPFLRAARARGLPIVDGLGMLLHQARPGFERWFGVTPEVDDALRAAVLA